MSKKKNNLLIAASGTGGHIFPALSIAEKTEKYWKISWLGIENRCESKLVPKKYKLFALQIHSPKKKNIFLLFQYLRIIFATVSVIKIINREKVNLVFTSIILFFKGFVVKSSFKEYLEIFSLADITDSASGVSTDKSFI